MARTLILHIGTSKTGSTSIQHKLARERKSLLAQGFYYPETEGDYKHTVMAIGHTSFSGVFEFPTNHVWEGRDPAQVITEYDAKFAAEMAALPPEVNRVIISAEQFSQYVRNPEDIQRLHDKMAAYFDDFRVVIYLRRQDAHFASTYAQSLRVGRIGAPDMTRLSDWLNDYDYAEILGRWARVFGEAAMRPRIFERLPGKPFDVVTDFADLCGLVLPEGDDEPTRNVSMNLRGQRILLETSDLYQKETQARDFRQSNAWRRLSIAVSKALPGKGWQPTRAEAAAFMAQFAQSNEEVRRKYLPERETLFDMDFSSLPESAAAADPEADFKAACSVILELVQAAVRRDQHATTLVARKAAKDGDAEAERAALRSLLEFDAADVGSRLRLAKLQIDEGAFAAAKQNLKQALRFDPDSKRVPRLLTYLERKAERAARKAGAKRPKGGIGNDCVGTPIKLPVETEA